MNTGKAISRVYKISDQIVRRLARLSIVREYASKLLEYCSKKLHSPEKIVLFGAMNGNWYGDNAMHLFLWVVENRPDIKPIWVTRNYDVYFDLKHRNLPVVMQLSIKGFKILCTARVGVFTDSLRDLLIDPLWCHKDLRLVALRHGRSVKRVRFARLNHKISEKERAERENESKRWRK